MLPSACNKCCILLVLGETCEHSIQIVDVMTCGLYLYGYSFTTTIGVWRFLVDVKMFNTRLEKSSIYQPFNSPLCSLSLCLTIMHVVISSVY